MATYQEDASTPYCVDSFRFLGPAEKDPEDWGPYQPRDFVLSDQYGGAGADELPRMLALAAAHAARP
ncbi:hypothetical protein OS965_02430 [Streptomyces sp. H27-G5]|uniref:hypothetical protein n=1 Tax=Streptomyces sp. H27-G5 TaxID=2996698 RepID=UPI002270053A|nr:hypothetical protein [Streptomyces sp. H27-G5]MCY0917033.1 hypothetical protein [Streptomyces sp. H27-G5]